MIGGPLGRWLLSLLLLAAWGLGATPARAQTVPSCQFVLGFQSFHDLLPDIVGSCLGDEVYNPLSGDAAQRTTGGLLVWQKADNLVAFTDGSRTLVDGPYGLQARLNTCRFVWEANPASLPLTSSPACAGSASPQALFGVNMHPLQPLDYQSFSNADLLDRAAAVGASLVRIDVHWAWIESLGPGTDLWTQDQIQHLNAFVDAAAQRHIQVLAVVTESPCWALAVGPAGCTDEARMDLPADPEDFAAFLSRLVPEYKGRIQYWEIWNEPNLAPHPNPVAYASLLQATYPVIKAADPTAIVLGGSLALVGPGAGAASTLSFLSGMYAAGAKGSLDALSYHPYTNGREPTWYDAQFPMLSFVDAVPAVHQVMAKNGDSRPIWLTEAGWSTVSPPLLGHGADPNEPLPATEADQRTFLMESLVLMSRWTYVQAYIWYEAVDETLPGGDSAEDHFGLFRRDLSPKPAALWLAHQRQQQLALLQRLLHA